MNKDIIWVIIGFILIILFIIGIHSLVSSPTYDSNDKKCDICGEKVFHTLNGEEYCEKHYLDAFKYYYKIK